MPDDVNIAGWLGLTSQQYEILKVVLDLQLEKKKASPKAIVDQYAGTHGKRLQKSNLFTQLGFLMDNDLLIKEGKADYSVNFEGVTNKLSKTREKLLKGFEEFERVATDVEQYLRKATTEPTKPIVKYLDYGEVHDFLERRIRYANDYLSISLFPAILTYPVPKTGSNRTAYLETLSQRCFKRKELHAVYITQLDIGHLFRKLVNTTGDIELSYDDCEAVINQFEQYVQKYDNLDIRFVNRPLGFDFSIPVIDESNIDEFFVFIRDNTEEINGGVYIKSQDTARKIHSKFMGEYESAEKIDKSNVKKWATKLQAALKHEHSLYVDKFKKKKNETPQKLTY